MRNEKKPIRASVTAAIAAIRAAPSDFTKSKNPCTVCPTRRGAQCAPYPARFAQFKVSVRLIPDEKHGGITRVGNARLAVRRQFAIRGEEGLLAVLLDARRAQPGETMLVDRSLPGKELFDGQRIPRTGFLERQKAAAHCSDHFRLSADDPTLCRRRRQVRNRQRTTIRPDDILDPRAMGFVHWHTHKNITRLTGTAEKLQAPA